MRQAIDGEEEARVDGLQRPHLAQDGVFQQVAAALGRGRDWPVHRRVPSAFWAPSSTSARLGRGRDGLRRGRDEDCRRFVARRVACAACSTASPPAAGPARRPGAGRPRSRRRPGAPRAAARPRRPRASRSALARPQHAAHALALVGGCLIDACVSYDASGRGAAPLVGPRGDVPRRASAWGPRSPAPDTHGNARPPPGSSRSGGRTVASAPPRAAPCPARGPRRRVVRAGQHPVHHAEDVGGRAGEQAVEARQQVAGRPRMRSASPRRVASTISRAARSASIETKADCPAPRTP